MSPVFHLLCMIILAILFSFIVFSIFASVSMWIWTLFFISFFVKTCVGCWGSFHWIYRSFFLLLFNLRLQILYKACIKRADIHFLFLILVVKLSGFLYLVWYWLLSHLLPCCWGLPQSSRVPPQVEAGFSCFPGAGMRGERHRMCPEV